MTSKIVVNNIEADAGVSTVTFNSNVERGSSNLHSTGLALGAGSTVGAVTGVTTYYGDGSQLTGISADVVDDTSPQLGANLDTNSKCIDFGDSNTGTVNRLRFGASTDLEIFHNGTNNHIDCHTAGQDLYIRPTKDVYIQDYDTDDKHIKMVKDGAVELYHNNSKKIETTASGVSVTGGVTASGASTFNEDITFTGTNANIQFDKTADAIEFLDNAEARFGTGDDLKIFHDGTNSHLRSITNALILRSDALRLNNAQNSKTMIKADDGGAVELYHDNRLRAYTVSNAFYVEQAELNDDCDLMINNKSTSIGDNQKSQLSCRVAKDAGGSHGGTNRTATFGHNFNSSNGGGGFFTIRSNDGTHRDFYMDNSTNLRVNYGHANIGTTNGTVVGSQSSDIRNKNLVGDGSVSYGLSEILQLNPIKYQYKKELVDRIGFSAQQVEPIIPESVYDTKQDQDNEGNTVSGDTIKAMYYVDLIPVLVNGIKELKAENDALKKRLDDAGL